MFRSNASPLISIAYNTTLTRQIDPKDTSKMINTLEVKHTKGGDLNEGTNTMKFTLPDKAILKLSPDQQKLNLDSLMFDYSYYEAKRGFLCKEFWKVNLMKGGTQQVVGNFRSTLQKLRNSIQPFSDIAHLQAKEAIQAHKDVQALEEQRAYFIAMGTEPVSYEAQSTHNGFQEHQLEQSVQDYIRSHTDTMNIKPKSGNGRPKINMRQQGLTITKGLAITKEMKPKVVTQRKNPVPPQIKSVQSKNIRQHSIKDSKAPTQHRTKVLTKKK